MDPYHIFYGPAPDHGWLSWSGARGLPLLIAVSAVGGLFALYAARFIVKRQNKRRIDKGDGDRKYNPQGEIAWDECRNAVTRPLRWAAAWFVFILVAALADGCGYAIVNSSVAQWKLVAASPIIAAIIVPAARKWVPHLVQLAISKPTKSAAAARLRAVPGSVAWHCGWAPWRVQGC